MGEKLSLKQGEKLTRVARKSIDYSLASGLRLAEACDDKQLLEQRGVFVTLHSFPGKELRGCIGFPYPVKPLWNAVLEMAVEAAIHDPRFSPMTSDEMKNTIVEISVLTKPEEILCERKKLPKFVKIGEDGLIAQRGGHSGLLLPIVGAEFKWDAENFLKQTCRKAGLPETAWRMTDTQVFKFQAQVFCEETPGRDIREINLQELLNK